MKTIVVCGVTERAGLLDELESGLAAADLSIYIDTVAPMPEGPNSMTMRRKIGFVRQMAEMFWDHDRIVVSDGWDVLFFGLPPNLPEQVIVSAESNCYPDSELSPMFMLPGPWKFVNAGLMSGSPKSLIEWCERVEEVGFLDQLDQGWLNKCLAYGWMNITVDWRTRFFYTVSANESDWLARDYEGPLNLVHRTRPCFFHFSGKTDPGPWKRLMG